MVLPSDWRWSVWWWWQNDYGYDFDDDGGDDDDDDDDGDDGDDDDRGQMLRDRGPQKVRVFYDRKDLQ